MCVGVGTILTPEQARDVKAAGAHFGVSPGLNPKVVRAARACGLPFAPGVMTPSDVELAAVELGCRLLKFFPAMPAGGPGFLKSMSAPYAHLGVQYIPLGGVNADNMGEWLGLRNVLCVGGSWIAKGDLSEVEQRAAEVTASKPPLLYVDDQ